MTIRLLRLVVIAAITTLLGRGLAFGAPCEKVNLLSPAAADLAKLIKDKAGIDPNADWLRHALRCSLGPFVVYGPASGSTQNLIVTEKSRFITIITPEDTLVFKPSNRLVTSLSDRDHDGSFDWIHYRGRDLQTGADVSVVDSGFDGVADMRTIQNPDGSYVHWMWVEGTWVQRVERDGATGYLVEGEFVPNKEAAAELLRRLRAR